MKKKYNELLELFGELESDKVTEIIIRTEEKLCDDSENINHSENKNNVDISSQNLYKLHLPIKGWMVSQILKLSKQEDDFLDYLLNLPRKIQVEFYNYSLIMISRFNPDDYENDFAKQLKSFYTRLSIFCMILMCIDYCIEVEMVLESLPLPIAENVISQVGGLDVALDKKVMEVYNREYRRLKSENQKV